MVFADAFQQHMKTLKYIRDHNHTTYHTLMASLYNECMQLGN
jgi:hypothetical protein